MIDYGGGLIFPDSYGGDDPRNRLEHPRRCLCVECQGHPEECECRECDPDRERDLLQHLELLADCLEPEDPR